MSTIDSTSRARAVGAGAQNATLVFTGENITSKILIAAQYDPLKTSVVDDVPVLILNEADAGDKAGFGFPAHRIAKKVFKGNQGAGEVWWCPQADPGGAVKSAGEIAWTGTTSAAGYVYLRIANELYQIAIPSGSTIEETSDLVVAEVNADPDTPVVAAKTAVTFETTFTAKSAGAHGDLITITLSADQEKTPAEALPTGLTAVITAMTGGTGIPDIDDTLGGMGVAGSDDANEKGFTALVHNNGLDTDTIDKIQAYVGSPIDQSGCHSPLVGRWFTCLNGDTTAGSAGLTALEVITDARLTTQSGFIFAAPDEDEIPYEIAAQVTAIIERIGQVDPSLNYSEQVVSGIGKRSISANRWTRDYSQRDYAIGQGISPSAVKSTEVYIQNVVSMYRPNTIPVASNGWSSKRSSKLQLNITYNLRLRFSQSDYIGKSIVADKSLVTDNTARDNVIDLADVQTDLNNFIDNVLVAKGWIFDGDYAKANSTVDIRALGNGFDITLKTFESGELQIVNITHIFDKNIAAVA